MGNKLFMKAIFLIASFLWAQVTLGQSNNVDSVEFCSRKFKMPTDCSGQSPYQITCEGSLLFWIYMNEHMLTNLPEFFIEQMTREMKEFKKEPIATYLLGTKVTGYKMTYKVEGNTAYQIVSYGIVNGQPVMVQLSLYDKEPMHNDDLPAYVRQILTLAKE